MTQSFDEWYFDAKQHNTDGFTNREFYEAGQQSRQEEVDKLKSEIDELKWMLKNSNGQADDFCKKFNGLQKRIDKALVQISNHYHSCVARKDLKRMSVSISEIAEIEAHESNMCVLENILKGNQDD